MRPCECMMIWREDDCQTDGCSLTMVHHIFIRCEVRFFNFLSIMHVNRVEMTYCIDKIGPRSSA